MRVYEITLFVLLFSLFLSFGIQEGLYASNKFAASSFSISSPYIQSLNISNIDGEVGYKPFGGDDSTNFILSTLTSLGKVVDIIWGATFGLGNLLSLAMGGSAEAQTIAALITYPVWLVYIFAIAQFLRGVGAKSIE